MTEFFYTIAGVTVRVTGLEDQMYREDGLLAPYKAPGTSWDHTIHMELTEQLDSPRGELVFTAAGRQVYRIEDGQIRYEGPHMRICRKGNSSLVQVEKSAVRNGFTPKMVLNAMEAEHFIVQNRGFLLHTSYIRWQDKGILFTAPSGTGKSTQADLWCRFRGAELLNGDRAAVMIRRDTVKVCGIPFSGSSGVYKNVELPLAAIVCLSQAPITTIMHLKGLTAFRRIWEGCSVNVWNREDMDLCTGAVMTAAERVPVFHLACTPDESAVIALEQELLKQR